MCITINPFSPRPAKTVHFVIIFTLSNTRQYYSLRENLWVGKGKVQIHALEQLCIFFRKFRFTPPKKNRYLKVDRRVRHDINSTYQTKASVTQTDFRYRVLSQWHCYEHGRSVFKRNQCYVVQYVTHADLSRIDIATQIADANRCV